eukprot:m.1114955 g.1114955  ORF g.1114955 m.1114955 type:complete len:401 (+) comp24368_c0_seq31:2106-3308(+)
MLGPETRYLFQRGGGTWSCRSPRPSPSTCGSLAWRVLWPSSPPRVCCRGPHVACVPRIYPPLPVMRRMRPPDIARQHPDLAPSPRQRRTPTTTCAALLLRTPCGVSSPGSASSCSVHAHNRTLPAPRTEVWQGAWLRRCRCSDASRASRWRRQQRCGGGAVPPACPGRSTTRCGCGARSAWRRCSRRLRRCATTPPWPTRGPHYSTLCCLPTWLLPLTRPRCGRGDGRRTRQRVHPGAACTASLHTNGRTCCLQDLRANPPPSPQLPRHRRVQVATRGLGGMRPRGCLRQCAGASQRHCKDPRAWTNCIVVAGCSPIAPPRPCCAVSGCPCCGNPTTSTVLHHGRNDTPPPTPQRDGRRWGPTGSRAHAGHLRASTQSLSASISAWRYYNCLGGRVRTVS